MKALLLKPVMYLLHLPTATYIHTSDSFIFRRQFPPSGGWERVIHLELPQPTFLLLCSCFLWALILEIMSFRSFYVNIHFYIAM